MTPAVMMVGCSDYEDTEVTSPEADADAIGAYFKSSATSAHLSPEQTSFQVVLNRASFSEAVNVPVKVTANDDNFSLCQLISLCLMLRNRSATR